MVEKGDHNNSYFHNILKGRWSKIRIISVKDELGRTFYDEDVGV